MTKMASYCFCIFIMQAGIILCCLGLAIFGITEVPTEGLEFDAGDFVIDGSAESAESLASPFVGYTPPVAGAEQSTKNNIVFPDADPELGAANIAQSTGSKEYPPAESHNPSSTLPVHPPESELQDLD
jgi:hypothetical protein